MADLDEQVRVLELKFATTAAQFISLHEDNQRLLREVAKLNEKVAAMNLQYSQGKGVAIGVFLFFGSVFTIINQYFSR